MLTAVVELPWVWMVTSSPQGSCADTRAVGAHMQRRARAALAPTCANVAGPLLSPLCQPFARSAIMPCRWQRDCGRGASAAGVRDQGRWLTATTRHRPGPPSARQMIEPRQRAVLDGEGKRSLRRQPQCQPQRSADGAPVRHGNDILAAMLEVETLDRRRHAAHEIGKALPARRALVGRRKPQRVRADPSRRIERLALLPLPFAQMLLGKVGNGQRRDPRQIGRASAAARIAAAVCLVRARLLVTQTASRGSSRARMRKISASLQSQSRSLCP